MPTQNKTQPKKGSKEETYQDYALLTAGIRKDVLEQKLREWFGERIVVQETETTGKDVCTHTPPCQCVAHLHQGRRVPVFRVKNAPELSEV